MELVLLLSILIGVSLGLFGGGGSILTVPLLVYAAGMETKSAIATSLLVVGITSAAALVPHARAGNVRLRVGVVFGSAGMAGAYAGGQLARFVPGGVLLLLFAAMMIATALAMVRARPTTSRGDSRVRPLSRIAAEGLAVGLLTGLVGAGGGFLVVPALALFGGLPMPMAVGTSLLVIAMNTFAGFLGYVDHVRIDYGLAGAVAAAATAGSWIGARLTTVVHPDRLRRGFAAFVLLMAAFVIHREAPALLESIARRDGWLAGVLGGTDIRLILHDLAPLPWPLAGALLGTITLLLLWGTGRRLGISTGLEDLCGLALRTPYFERGEIVKGRRWRLPFLGGLVLGGVLSASIAGGWAPSWDLGRFDATFGWGPAAKLVWMFAGGVLIGFGARTAGGCTSGHGIFGVSNLERAGIVSTLSFLAAGIATSHLVYRLGGG